MTSRKIFLPIALGVYSLTAYASFHAYKLYLLPDVSPLEASDPSKQPDVSDRYGTLAKEYDDAVGWDEWMMGLPGKRRELLRWAHGDVLEVSSGTGRNMDSYLPSQISSLLLTDKNQDMLSVASLKALRWSSLKGASHVSVGLRSMDAGNLIGLKDNSYDSIVQTFGLCSVSDPSRVLEELRRVCKPGGSLLLLEHGRGDYDWLNKALDKTASAHANAWGCFWNRDIQKLIDQSEWVVEESQRFHLGTTHMYRLSKRDKQKAMDGAKE